MINMKETETGKNEMRVACGARNSGGCVISVGDAVRERIRQLCWENHITLNKLATISGVTQSTLNNIISGRNKSATVSTIKKICDGLNITLLAFFDSDLFLYLDQELK